MPDSRRPNTSTSRLGPSRSMHMVSNSAAYDVDDRDSRAYTLVKWKRVTFTGYSRHLAVGQSRTDLTDNESLCAPSGNIFFSITGQNGVDLEACTWWRANGVRLPRFSDLAWNSPERNRLQLPVSGRFPIDD